ncbi:START domain-containing protein [Rozella allomycis CSF55]|uniref:START domain-containing protein n=1 Tax=Rozella allomycis (strain CSF55) TaxID=988480 RepID=A0A075B2K4_ROZAC|nr:START domain-containing protein [Rozella allomycis CSF55]|eukprot:EPZ35176.1 START domain-containing protein [Rozella allomycis CSF55]
MTSISPQTSITATAEKVALTADSDSQNNIFKNDIKDMVEGILKVFDSPLDPNEWESTVDNDDIQIYQNKRSQCCFRIHASLQNCAESCFDLLSDPMERPKWDELCEFARVVEEVDKFTRIVYVRMKPVWPTSARDVVLLSHVTKLPDGRLLNVTKSITHPDCPDLSSEGIVRMEAGIAGQICIKSTSNRCKLIQIADGDLGGWIPKSVIKFVATKALPNSFKAVNKILCKIEQKEKSHLAEGESTEEVDLLKELAVLKSRVNKLEEMVESLTPSGIQLFIGHATPIVAGITAIATAISIFRSRRQ